MASIRDVDNVVLDRLRHLFLPSFALGLRYLALTARFTRASLLENLGQDYIITARAKGQWEMGSVLTAVVFGWPGIGRLMYDAIYSRDYPILLGIFFIVSIFVILVNLVIDLLYSVIDPRVRVAAS